MEQLRARKAFCGVERGSMMNPLGKVENAPLWREVMFEIERYTTT